MAESYNRLAEAYAKKGEKPKVEAPAATAVEAARDADGKLVAGSTAIEPGFLQRMLLQAKEAQSKQEDADNIQRLKQNLIDVMNRQAADRAAAKDSGTDQETGSGEVVSPWVKAVIEGKGQGKVLGAILLFFVLLLPARSLAATVSFDRSAIAVKTGGTATVTVGLDAGDAHVIGTDIYMAFDPKLVAVQSVSAGPYFPFISHKDTEGQTHISGVILDPSAPKSGAGKVAVITFKGIGGGTGNITLVCDTSRTDASKIVTDDLNAPNVIDCSHRPSPVAVTVTDTGLLSRITSFLFGWWKR